MARLVGVFASSHAPLIIRGWKDVKPANQKELTSSLAELGRRIKAAKPDVLVEQNLPFGLSLAYRCYVLNKGRIVHESTPDALRGNEAVTGQYLGV